MSHLSGTALNIHRVPCIDGLLMASGKDPPVNAGDERDIGLIPGYGRSPKEGHGNPLQYSFLENHMGRRTWLVTVHRAAKCGKGEKGLSTQVPALIVVLAMRAH